MRARDFLYEAAAPAIGRKYQHIEDLVFTNGSTGGQHAVERLRDMLTHGDSIELKWDGSPVVYWGRDEDRTFRMVPKNAWEYAKRGRMELEGGINVRANSAEDVAKFVAGTGRVDPEQEAQRRAFASQLASLWPLLERAAPKTGYLEGGLLFWPAHPPVLNKQTGEYDFQPNVTEFHVRADSALGKRIARAKVMIAATGYYPTFGSSDEGRAEDLDQLSTAEVIVQGTTYVNQPPRVDTRALDAAAEYIEKNSAAIDAFLAPKPGLSKPGDVLYKFYNQNLRLPGVKARFQQWAQENLSAGQSAKILADTKGLDAVLNSVEQITAVKEQMIAAISGGTYGDVRQTRPEGYVQAHPGRPYKYDMPGQFVKTISQATWSPRKDA
jgi:hypothetical protein